MQIGNGNGQVAAFDLNAAAGQRSGPALSAGEQFRVPGASPAPVPGVSAFTANLGDLLIAAVLKSGSTSEMMELGIREDVLHEPEKGPWKALQAFVRKHGAVPSVEAFVRETGLRQLPTPSDPPSYYAGLIRDRYIKEGAAQAMLNMSNRLKLPNTKGTDLLEKTIHDLLVMRQNTVSHGLYDAREMHQRVIATYQHDQMNGSEKSITLGWDYIDVTCGGIMPGDILSWVGRPATGKTWLNLQSAIHPWLTQNKRVMFVTTEMLRAQIEARMAAMVARVPVRGVLKASLATPQLNRLRDKLTEISHSEAPFWILDAHAGVTVEDIWALCSMLGIEWLVIDGAYLLAHPDRRLDRFTRVAENCRLFKSELASNLKLPLAASWQFSREMAKKKNAKGKKGGEEKAGLEDIGFSDEIGQISSLVLATLEAESVETIRRRRIDVMKGRNGETGNWLINWDFVTMDFSEYTPVTHETLRFI